MASRITQADIEQGLRELGLHEGDVVLLHSSLSSFGDVAGGARTVVEAFLAVLGEQGTLAVPTFGSLGVVTEVVRDDPRAVRSIHPLASVAAIGAAAEAICKNHWKAETAHAQDTPYMRIAERGGYVCLAGVDQDRSTTLHTAEELLRLPYLTDRTRTFMTETGEVTRTYRSFPGPHRDFIGLDRLLRKKGVMRFGRIGDSVVRLMKSQDLIDVCVEAGRADPAFVLCDNPNCADCVAQRAAIRRDRFGREAFTLASGSGLAGRTVPEMIEDLKAAGIGHVELDQIQGQPIHVLRHEELRVAVDALRNEELDVIALRCRSVPESVGELMDHAVEIGVGRIVLPMSTAAQEHATLASHRGLNLSLSNNVEGSVMASEILLALRDSGATVGLTFNGPGFARAGETPFLYSYKQKLRRFVDQLDVEDARFDGTAQPLAQGNAEVKEMVSILRCSSFGGWMVLTTPNRPTGDLRTVVARFEALLDAM